MSLSRSYLKRLVGSQVGLLERVTVAVEMPNYRVMHLAESLRDMVDVEAQRAALHPSL